MTNFEKVKELITIETFKNDANSLCNYIHEFKNEVDCYGRNGRKCEECYKWLAQEYHEQILDDVERKYLGAVIKPFRDRVEYIVKRESCVEHSEKFIYIECKEFYDGFALPCFKSDTMYKNMKKDKEYTLEELGL